MSGKLNQYPIELVKRESVETFGKCFIPRKIMKQENIHSGNIIVIKATIDDICYSFVTTVWEKKNMTNSLIELYPCCFKSTTLILPDTQYIIGNLSLIQKKIPTALRLTIDTTLQTYSSSFPRRLSQYLHRCPVFIGGCCCIGSYPYTITSSLPNDEISICITDTTILLSQTKVENSISSTPYLHLSKEILQSPCPLPGLETCYSLLLSSILYYGLYKDQIKQSTLSLYKGILLCGDHGVGKSKIIQCAIQYCSCYMNIYSQSLSLSTIQDRHYGESSQSINQVFLDATRFASANETNVSIIVIDDIDILCHKRNEYDQENTQIVSQLLTCIDGLKAMNHILVLATTTKPYLIDDALRRAGRFDKEIAILPPTQEQRYHILSYYFKQYHLYEQVHEHLQELSYLTRGFSGADIECYVRNVILQAIEEISDLSTIPSLSLSFLLSILASIKPSIMKDQEQVTGISWNEIGGMESIKHQLQQFVEWPVLHKEQFTRFHLAPPRGILLYGPPGCAKTTLARALAAESHVSFWTMSTSQIFTPYVGESEFIIRNLFARARAATPAIVFLDEIDALVCKRSLSGGDDVVQSRVMATFLTEMDGIENSNGIIVVGATNRPEMIDDALLRPGRFDKLIFVPSPDFEGRKDIFKVYTKHLHTDESLNLDELATLTEGYSGADIENICREAVYNSLRSNIHTTTITQSCLLESIQNIQPSITKEMNERYIDFQNSFYQ